MRFIQAELAGVHFIELEHRNWKNYTLIEGFPGMGLVGTISAKYLVENLKFKEVGHIESDVFVPIIRISNGIPVHPSRIYVNDELKLVALISEQIIPKQHIAKVADAMVCWIKEKGIRKMISLAGIQTGLKNDMNVYGIAANQKSKQVLKAAGVKIIEEGITTGITAMMLLKLKKENIEAVSLMGNVTFNADYKASAEILKALDKVLELKLNLGPLYEQAKEAEKQLVNQLKMLEETAEREDVKKVESKDTPMYV